jgi:Caspase domain/Domain of unknown function (DUF4384)
MAFKRRHFLQFAGSTLAALGYSHTHVLAQAGHYGRILAQPTPRKLALLVGINRYPEPIGALNGCLTDVELQKYLLIHRFGFHPADILEVSDHAALKPTRRNILQAFETHLIQQAKPGDVAVFHYSGHGDRIRDPNPLSTDACRQIGDCDRNGTIVPIDGMPQTDSAEVVVPDIMGQTLFLLTQALPTEQITLILDCCHSGAGTRGTVTVRAARRRAGKDQVLVPSAIELDYQQQLASRLGLSADQVQQRRQAGIAKGVAIGSASRNQLAVDAQFKGFYAGGFTYLLTRYLWQLTQNQATGTVYINLKRSTNSLSESQQGRSQIPVFEYRPEPNAQQPLYFTEMASLPAEAVLLQNNPLRFWLGGVSAQNIANPNGTVFTVIDAQGQAIGEIEQTRRMGLYGEGRLVAGAGAMQPGMLLREKVIGLPAQLTLNVAVDPSLEGSLAQVRSELQSVNRVTMVGLQHETGVDYLFGRFPANRTPANRTPVDQTPVDQTPVDQTPVDQTMAEPTSGPAVNSLGLFLPDLTPLTDTFGPAGESIRDAIARLRPRFKRLLVNRILGQLMTAGSSSLRVRATLSAVNGPGAVVRVASRSVMESEMAAGETAADPIPSFRAGTLLQLAIENLEPEQDLYLSVLVIGSDGLMNVLYPQDWNAPEEAARIDRRGSLQVPRPQDSYAFTVSGSSGSPELLLLVSTEPLRSALKGMQAIARGRGLPNSRGPLVSVDDDDSLQTLDQLLADLNTLSRGSHGTGTAPASAIAFDTSKLVVLSMVIEVGDNG